MGKYTKKFNPNSNGNLECCFCQKEFKNIYGITGHLRSCKLNPKYEEFNRKRSVGLTGKKLSLETRKKISETRKRFLNENPNRVPYLLVHSSSKSYLEERFEQLLINNGITGWIYNYSFKRFVLDFSFPEWKLDVELDGQQHTSEWHVNHDLKRDAFLNEHGWNVLRFTHKQVLNEPFECLNKVLGFLGKEKIVDLPEDFIKYKKHKEIFKYIESTSKTRSENMFDTFEKNKKLAEAIPNLPIDFSKIGWVNIVSEKLGISHAQCRRIILAHIPEFLIQENVFSRNKNRLVSPHADNVLKG